MTKIMKDKGVFMKKLIFGLGLLFSGVFGFVGWCNAVAQTVEQGSKSDVFGCFDGSEWIILFVFVIMAITGLFFAINELIHKE